MTATAAVRRAVVPLSAVLLSVAVVGCTPSESRPSTQVASALHALSELPPELRVAHRLAWRDCMNELGWSVPFDASTIGHARASLIGLAEIFASESDAAAFGYSTTIGKVPTLIDEYEEALPERDRERFTLDSFGDGSKIEETTLPNGTIVSRSLEGCTAEADIAVYGSVAETLVVQEFVNEINAQSVPMLAQAQAIVADLDSTYSACMSDAGLELSGLQAGVLAEETFGRYRQPGDPPAPAEAELAVTDFRCQERAGYRESLDDLFLERGNGWIAENESRILGIRESLDNALARAQEIIGA